MEITKEDVPYQLHQLLDIIGSDRFLEVCKMYGGSATYIPMYSTIMMGVRNRKLIEDFNGRNIENLRVRYGMSKSNVRRILHEEGLI